MADASRKKVEGSLSTIDKVVKYVSEKHYNFTLEINSVYKLKDEQNFLRAIYLGQMQIEQY